MRIWKLTLLGALLSLSINTANALASNIINFDQLVKAVERGDDVKAIIHFDNCQITDKALQEQLMRNLEGATTRFNFTRFLHAKVRVNNQLTDTVTTSMESQIMLDSGVIWTVFGRLNVYEDDTAILHVDFYDPITHKNQLDVDWECDISNGRDNKGLILLDYP